ncbi:DUF4339 domain-containing protein [Rhodopirellula bahusiensis]|uniref:GYF domain-containing protein n=1 Tax=Rhodopirellula bahusiensis TaxID=2014065 RepID=A0A2G1W702_9BACT|nr:DUF4339 domain-containing protein [Rhodopirellula bahusiensis]PHQ34823.1 hypothetical protein CEE69_13205 [Rhodopirellula bahusiensis]
MANQWYYSRENEKFGPFGDSDLRKMAVDGVLKPDDQIWKEGMAKWRTAGSVKGLFPQSAASPLRHKPGVVENDVPPQIYNNREETVSFGGSAKLASQLAAKQTEFTKIHQVLLPKEYHIIGQRTFETQFERETHESQFSEIEKLNQNIAELESAEATSPEAKTFTDKAKSLGNQAVIAGKLKTAHFQRRQKLIALGKSACAIGNVPQACLNEQENIGGLLERSGILQSEIDALRKEASAAGKSLMASTAVVASFACLCAPIGLFLIWRHPTWSKDAKLKWAGASLGCFLLLGIIGQSKSKPDREWLEYNGNKISTEGLSDEKIADLKAKGATSTRSSDSESTNPSGSKSDTDLNDIARGVAYRIKNENLWSSMTPNGFHLGLEEAVRAAGRADLLPLRATSTNNHDTLSNVTTIYMEYNKNFGVGFAIDHSNSSKSKMTCSKIWLDGATISP